MARITIEHAGGIEVSIKVPNEYLGELDTVFNEMVVPVLLAAGYQQKTINEYFELSTVTTCT